MPDIETVFHSNAGAELFNGLTRMHLYNADTGYPILFSRRRDIVRRFIGQLLESHLLPESFMESFEFPVTTEELVPTDD